MVGLPKMDCMAFLSTPSARRATWLLRCRQRSSSYFYPRPPRGGRLQRLNFTGDKTGFLSTPSARRATGPPLPCIKPPANFYPRPPRGGRPSDQGWHRSPCQISIHALREEGDRCSQAGAGQHRICIHALSEEGDGKCDIAFRTSNPFLSTPSARRATYFLFLHLFYLRSFLSTPSARRATIRPPVLCCPDRYFYPRPPRGGRLQIIRDVLGVKLFLSTPSARRATVLHKVERVVGLISIHALREEGDDLLQVSDVLKIGRAHV